MEEQVLEKSSEQTVTVIEEIPETKVIDVNLPACQLVGAFKIDLAQPRFSAIEARDKIMSIVAAVPALDSNAVISYAVEPQMKANSYLDELVGGLKTTEAGAAGMLTPALLKGIKDIKAHLEKIQKEARGEVVAKAGNFLTKFFSSQVSALQEFKEKHTEIIKYFEKTQEQSQIEIGKLTATNDKLDRLVDVTLENLRDLEMHLAAGQSIVYRERAIFEKNKIAAKESGDLIAVAGLRDHAEKIRAFETRLVHIHLALTEALNSVPEIRATQEAARIQIQNTWNTILFLLPSLKKNILRVVALKNVHDASASNKAQAEIDKEIRSLGDSAFKEVYIDAKKSQGDGMAQVLALEESVNSFLDTLTEGSKIDQENTAKLDEIHQKLNEVKIKLVEGLASNAENFVALPTGKPVEKIEDKSSKKA